MGEFKDSEEQLTIFDVALNTDSNILVDAKAGTGKCLGKGTKIRMYDGSLKNVEDIVEGDLLMGDNSEPRTVSNTNIGKGDLYEVIPSKGKSFICNDVHILTVKQKLKYGFFSTLDVPLNILIEKSNLSNFYLYKEIIDFPNDTVADYQSIGFNFFNQKLNDDIIYVSSENRRKIISGIINKYGKTQLCDVKFSEFDIEYNLELFKDLVQSLGYMLTYYDRGYNGYLLRGDFNSLENYLSPLIKETLQLDAKTDYTKHRFKINYMGVGDYYGFTLDGNGRFLLEDYIVTHNTTTIKGIVNRVLESNNEKKMSVVAFNEHIAKELKVKLPEDKSLYISTTHGIGFGAIKRKYKNAIVDANKIFKIIDKKSRSWNLDPTQINVSQYKVNLDKVVGLCKLTLSQTPDQIKFIAKKFGYELSITDLSRVRQILEASINDVKTFDFNDMVFVPSIDKKLFIFQSDYVIVDECLPSDQKIVLKKGIKSIGEIYRHYNRKYTKSLYAKSFNLETREYEYKKIEKVWRVDGQKDIYKVSFLHGSIKTTDTHKYCVVNINDYFNRYIWKRLSDIKVGDHILYNSDTKYKKCIGSEDINDYYQSMIMTRVLHSHKDNIITYENKYSEKTLLKYNDKIMKFNSSIKDFRNRCYRIISGGFIIKNFEYNKLNFIKNIMTEKHLAVIYMDTNLKTNPKNSFSIKAEDFDHFLIYKILIEKKFSLKEMDYKRITDKKYKLIIDDSQLEYFWNLIKKYLTDDYLEDEVLDVRYDWDLDRWDEIEVVEEIIKQKNKAYVYDITVEDNHNFIATTSKTHQRGVVLHNCQDYNKAQQQILKRMIKKDTGKLISFGDKNQAIYGFMGADSDSFNWFSERDNTVTLPLTTTYRCAKNIVKLAQTLVPDIRARENAPDGYIGHGSVVEQAEVGDMVLSRKNAPLVKLVFDLLDNNKIATIIGKKIGSELKDKISKLMTFNEVNNMINNSINEVIIGLTDMGITEFQTHPKYIDVRDNMSILVNLMQRSNSIGEMTLFIDKIFTDKPKGVILSTIHKSKGLEANRVFIIKPKEMKIKSPLAWMWQGELNLEYIAYTRAMNELILDKDWTDEQEDNNSRRLL